MGTLMQRAAKNADTKHGYLKMAVYGSQGTGKTTLAIDIAIGLVKKFGLTKPIVMADSETGAKHWRDHVLKEAGVPLVDLATANFDEMVKLGREAESDGSVFIIDSASKFWDELIEALRQRLKVSKLQPYHYVEPKAKWTRDLTNWMLNAKVHVIVCGRAGVNFTEQENEETGRLEMVADGSKLRAHGDFGHEPDLVVELQQHVVNGRGKKARTGKIALQAFVRKDRWRELNGAVFEFPKCADFMPHINHLVPGAPTIHVDLESRSEYGDDDREKQRYIRDRKVAVDIAKSLLVKVHGDGRSAEDKQKRIASIEEHWGTVSWAELEQKLPLTRIKQGIQSFQAKHGLAPHVPASDKTAEEILEGDDLPEDFGATASDAA
jgi:hypothetical protein